MAVAFLPVFYSKHALNDVVTLGARHARARRLAVRVPGRADRGLAARGRRDRRGDGDEVHGRRDAAGRLLAAALRVQQDRAELRRAVIGVVVAGVACLVVFAILNPFVILNPSEARGQIAGQSAQADTAKLGQDDTYGWLYYLGTLTWGLGWAPLLAAVPARW